MDNSHGPGRAKISCVREGCTAAHIFEDIQGFNQDLLISYLHPLGWSMCPDLCPEHGGQVEERAYVLIDRDLHPDVAVLYPNENAADAALKDSMLIDGLCEEDSLDTWVSTDLGWLAGREIIIP